MELAWTTEHEDGVTLVALTVENDGPKRRVRIHNSLDGPVRYPRREGQPAAGWNERGFEGPVPAGGRRPLGYACPAPPREPPAEIVDVAPVEASTDPTAVGAIRRLGDPRPPRDAVSGSDRRRASEDRVDPPAGGR